MTKAFLPFLPAMVTVQDWRSSDLECYAASPCPCFRYSSLFSNDHSSSISHRECTCLSMGVLDISIAMFSQIQNLLSDGCLSSASKAAIIHIFDVASTSMSCFHFRMWWLFSYSAGQRHCVLVILGPMESPNCVEYEGDYRKSSLLFVSFKEYFLGTSVWQSSANLPFQYTFRIFSS